MSGQRLDTALQEEAMTISSVNYPAYSPALNPANPVGAPSFTPTSTTTGSPAMPDPVTSDASAQPASANTAPAPSAVKEFVYGTLGLERPDEQMQSHNEYYSAGRIVAATATVGSILA
jgi:hypothetical protein